MTLSDHNLCPLTQGLLPGYRSQSLLIQGLYCCPRLPSACVNRLTVWRWKQVPPSDLVGAQCPFQTQAVGERLVENDPGWVLRMKPRFIFL